MSAQNTDKLRRGFFGSSTTLSASIGNTDTTIPVSSTTGWPTDTAIDITIDRVDANGNKTPTKRETITLVVSGINGINALRGVEGTAQPHSAGAIVEITFTAATHNDQVNWGLKDHDQQGRHTQLTDTNGNTILAFNPVSNAVNNLQVANSATGNDIVLSAVGSDANINIDWNPKGTGAHKGVVEALKNPYKFQAYLAGTVANPGNTWTQMKFDTVVFDTGSNYSTSTNMFTALVAGYYQFNGAYGCSTTIDGQFLAIGMNVNTFSTTPTYQGPTISNGAAAVAGLTMSKFIKLNANDTVSVYFFNNSPTQLAGTGPIRTYFEGFLVSAS
jgi:hypothetical protein